MLDRFAFQARDDERTVIASPPKAGEAIQSWKTGWVASPSASGGRFAMTKMNKITKSPEETKELAAELAAKLKPGDVLALDGELGSGKTCFVQGLAKGLGIPNNRYVRSPSFTLINEYEGKIPLYHFDFYRLNNAAEVADLGIDEYFEGQGITVVEWAEKFPGTLPERAVCITFEIISEDERKISFNNAVSL